MHYLSGIDYTVIGLYFLVLVGLGLYLRRRASQSMESYFLAGRSLPWWALGISGMASFLDMTGTMLIVAFLFALGPRGLYIEFRGGAVLILAVMMLWAGKWHRRSRCLTGAEWIAYRFGEGFSGHLARIVSAAAAFLFTVGSLAYLLKGAGLFLAMFMPLSPQTCAILLIGVATCYSMVSGFYGVVYADLLQSFIIMAGVICITVLAVQAGLAHPEPIGVLAEQITGTPNWTSSVPHWRPPMPPGERFKAYEYLLMSAWFFLLKNILQGMGSGGDPRYFGARNERDCGLLTFFWTSLMMFRWPMMMGFALLGIFLVRDHYPDPAVFGQAAALVHDAFPNVAPEDWEQVLARVANAPHEHPALAASLADLFGAQWPQKLTLVGFNGQINSERVLPAVLLFSIPRGLRGLLIIALIAAAVTTFASQVITTTALFTNDLYHRYFRRSAGNRELLFASYGFGVVLAAGGLWMAAASEDINNIWGWICMGLGTGMAMPGMLKFYWWRLSAGGVNIGMIVGMTAAVIQRAYAPKMHEWVQFLLISAISLLGTVLGSYLTRPTDPAVLEHFYRTTRPFGFWAPLRQRLDPAVQAIMRREHRRDVLALPFAVMWQITLFLLPMQLVIRDFRSFGWTLAIFVVSLAGLWLLWLRHLLKPTPRDEAELIAELEASTPRPQTASTPSLVPAGSA